MGAEARRHAPGPAVDLGVVVEQQGQGPVRRAEPQVGGLGGGSLAGIGRSEPDDVLPGEEDGVDEGHRVGDHEPGGHQHRPAAGEEVQRPEQQERAAPAHDEDDDPEHELVGCEQQRAGGDAHPGRDALRAGATPRNSAGGTFRGKRSSSPYAAPCAQERANDGIATSTTQRVVTARAAMDDRADGRPVTAASTHVHHASGAPVRAAVRPTGRGASSATNTTNHVTHRSTAAVARVASDHGSIASDSAAARAHRKRHPRDAQQQHQVHIIGASSLRRSREARSYTTNLMVTSPHADALAPGLATGIGSLPHVDARAAAELSRSTHPWMPAVPQLPVRDPREGLVAQWAGALPEVTVATRWLDQHRPRSRE